MRSFKMSSLDRERELSMADEGGMAAASMEGQKLRRPPIVVPIQPFFVGMNVLRSIKVWIPTLCVSVGIGFYLLKQKQFAAKSRVS